MDAIVSHLVRGIIAPRTLTTYRAVWHALTSFLHSVRLSPSLPLSVDLLLLYIAHMYSTGFASSTISSHCSAIGFVHHINSLPNPSHHPTVLRIIKRLTSTNPPDIRMPITIGLLGKLLHCLRHTCSSSYQILLFTAMFTTAFFAMLRISELTVTNLSSHVIMLNDVLVDKDFIILTIKSFKHSLCPASIRLLPRSDYLCPVKALLSFMIVRGNKFGPLFAYPNGEGIQRSFFTKHLHVCIHSIYPLHSHKYKSHSFRIGGATYLAQQGASDDQIRRAGRWRSNAFQAYVRV